MSTCTSNLVLIEKKLAEIRTFVYFGPLWPMYCPYLYQNTKFCANRSRIGRDTPFCVFSKMAAAAILVDLLYLHFGPSAMSPLLGWMFLLISLNFSVIQRFCDFVISAGKCQFMPILEVLWDFDPWNYDIIILTSNIYAHLEEPRALTYCAWISVQRSLLWASSKRIT